MMLKYDQMPVIGISKSSLALVFSYEFCKISKNTFFTKHLQGLLLIRTTSIKKKCRTQIQYRMMAYSTCSKGVDNQSVNPIVKWLIIQNMKLP